MFEIISDILHKKTGEFIGDNDAMEQFSAYMIQRWISMYSSHPIEFLNSTINISYKVFDDAEVYKFLLVSLPKYKFKRLNYIKKDNKLKKSKNIKPEDTIKLEENVDKLNRSLEMVFGKEL